MKNLLPLILLFCSAFGAAAAPSLTIGEPYYEYQAGISAGFNIAGSPVNGTGYHYGLMVRKGHHAVGFRVEREKDMGRAVYRWEKFWKKTGGYYSFTFAMEHFQWGPQIGIGKLEYDYHEISGNQYVNPYTDTDTYFEIAMYGLGGARGNGIGGKIFVLFSSIEKYVGFTVYVQAGYAWNAK